MRPKERRDSGQSDLFKARLDQIVDLGHPLARLAATIDWRFLEERFGAVYTDKPGQPPLPTRLMAGLSILKHAHDLSDEELCARWIENPYFQLFCDGMDGPGASVRCISRPSEGLDMSAIAIIGLDIAKNVFQVHGADADGAPMLRRKLRRGQILAFFGSLPPCLVALEACFTAHYWAREIAKHGHEVRMIPPQYVKPFVKRNKTDSADAEAICEAAGRPTMRFVAVKNIHQQSVLALHRARDLLVRQRTKLIQALRGYLGEFGLVAPKGAWNVTRLEGLLSDAEGALVPDLLKEVATVMIAQIRDFDDRINHLHDRLIAWHRANEVSRRLATVPGIGPVTASLISASVNDAAQFRSGRHFAAWIGLVPREHSTGGRQQLGGISKRGNPQMRRLLIVGAHAVLRWTRRGHGMPSAWLTALMGRRHPNVVAVAIANKLARIAWAIMTYGTSFSPQIARAN